MVRGGRNQELVLAALPDIKDGEIVVAINSDGWDNGEHAGALCDIITRQKADRGKLDPQLFLEEHNSFEFFRKSGDFLLTGRLGSNVADLMIALKK